MLKLCFLKNKNIKVKSSLQVRKTLTNTNNSTPCGHQASSAALIRSGSQPGGRSAQKPGLNCNRSRSSSSFSNSSEATMSSEENDPTEVMVSRDYMRLNFLPNQTLPELNPKQLNITRFPFLITYFYIMFSYRIWHVYSPI